MGKKKGIKVYRTQNEKVLQYFTGFLIVEGRNTAKGGWAGTGREREMSFCCPKAKLSASKTS